MDSNPWLAYPDYCVLVLPDHTHLLLAWTAVKIAINMYSANTPVYWETRRLCSTGDAQGAWNYLSVCSSRCLPDMDLVLSTHSDLNSLSRNYINPTLRSNLPWIKKFSQPYYAAIKPIFPVLLVSWTTANETTGSSKRRQHTYTVRQSGWQTCSAQKCADSGIILDSVLKQPSFPDSSRENRDKYKISEWFPSDCKLFWRLEKQWIDWIKVWIRNKLLILQAPVLLDVPYHAGSENCQNISGQYIISSIVLNFTSRKIRDCSLEGLSSSSMLLQIDPIWQMASDRHDWWNKMKILLGINSSFCHENVQYEGLFF